MSNTKRVEKERMPEYLSTLLDEHRYFQSLLDVAREQQALLDERGEVDLDILQRLLQYLAEYPEDHHHPREDLLFERLRDKDAGSGEALNTLLAGHEDIHKESSRLYFTVMRLNNGENIRRGPLARDLGRFVERYEKHMHDEEEVIFPRAVEVLGEEDWQALVASVEHIEDPLFGTRVRRRYRPLGNYLEARLGIVRRDFVAMEFLSLGALIDNMVTISDVTIGLASVLRDRTGQTWRENLAAARDGLRSRKLSAVMALPSKMTGNTYRNTKDGLKDSKDIVCKAMEDIRTPYNMRMDALKRMLREDWARPRPSG